jgi:hypothetical protein
MARYQIQAVARLVGGIGERAALAALAAILSSVAVALRLRLSARLCLCIHRF